MLCFHIMECLRGISKIRLPCYSFRMELRVLRYFLMAAQEENITKAAEILHVTQPTLSRQLADLEAELGVTLFERKSHRIKLRQDGLLLKRSAEEITALAEKVRTQFQPESDGISGMIAIGCGELQSMDELARLLCRFRMKYPQIHYDISSGAADAAADKMNRGIFDFALLLEPVDITSYEFIRMKTGEKWCALVQTDSPLAALPAITPSALHGIPLILPARGNIRNQVLNWLGCRENEITIAATANLPYNGAAAVRNGLGVSLTISLDCTYDGVTAIPLEPELTHGSVLAWKRDMPQPRAVEAFIRFAKDIYSKMPSVPNKSDGAL